MMSIPLFVVGFTMGLLVNGWKVTTLRRRLALLRNTYRVCA